MPKKRAVPEFKSEEEELTFWDMHEPEEFDDGPADEIIMAIKASKEEPVTQAARRMDMPKRKRLHVVPRGDGWAVVREGGKRARSRHNTQGAAVKAARAAAKNERGQLIVHRADGKIREERTYRHDTYPPRG